MMGGFDKYKIVVVSAVLREQPEGSIIAAAGVDFVDTPLGVGAKVDIITVIRSVEPWPYVVIHADRVANNPEFAMQTGSGDVILVIENTVGTPTIAAQVLDLDIYAMPVVLTGEQGERNDGMSYFIPAGTVVGALIAAYQSGRVEISAAIEFAETLESGIAGVTMRDAGEVGALVLSIAHIVYQADNALPSFGTEGIAEYDTYGGLD